MELAELYQIFKSSTGINTDSRTTSAGELFFALSGDNFDGNTFVDSAIEKGAAYAVCEKSLRTFEQKAIIVDDVLQTLQDLAAYHRRQLDLPVVGLTGSNGKTTTKELILSALSQKFNVSGTKGNLNNHIGVPLTILSFNEDTEIGVVEMGANHIGEIEQLSNIAQPNYGLITNFGKAHLDGFGSLEGVLQGKSELYENLRASNGIAIVLDSDEEQVQRTVDLERMLTPNLELQSSQPIKFEWELRSVKTQLTGAYNFNNMKLAAAIGLEFGLTIDQICEGLSNYIPENNRSQILAKQGYTLIMDAYNANPTSMSAALENLAGIEGFTTAILGDMFETGSYAAEEHQQIADYAVELGIDQTWLIGDNFAGIKNTECKTFKSFDHFKDFLKIEKQLKGTILIKGSRGMALERILKLL